MKKHNLKCLLISLGNLFNLTRELNELRVEIFEQMYEISKVSGLDYIFNYLVSPERIIEESLLTADSKLRYLELAFSIALKSGRYSNKRKRC